MTSPTFSFTKKTLSLVQLTVSEHIWKLRLDGEGVQPSHPIGVKYFLWDNCSLKIKLVFYKSKKKKKKKKKKNSGKDDFNQNYFSKCKATGILEESFLRKQGQGYRPAATTYKKNLFA